MLKLRLYTMNFLYSPEGEFDGVLVSFSSLPHADQHTLNGSIRLTAEEFNEGNTLEKVRTKVIALLAVEEPA